MELLSVTCCSASILLDPDGDYYARETADLFLNGEKLRREERSVFDLTGLMPDTEYLLTAVYPDREDRFAFRTEKETCKLDVRRFGAVGDGAHDDTAALQAAIACCPDFGRVCVPPGVYLTGPLFLKSRVTLEIREGAVFTHDSGSGWYALYVLGIEDNSYHTVSVRHILIKAQDADGDGSVSDDEKAASLAAVTALRDSWLAGDATEDSFAELAREQSEDEGSAENGGLYENIHKGQMVEQFDAFCFGGHKKGDIDIVYGESASYSGYHLIYFVGEDAEPYSRVLADNDLRTEAYNNAIDALTQGLSAERTFMWRYVMKH